MSSSEQRGFVFSVVFIIVFAALLSTVPTGLQGTGGSGTELVEINPDILVDFAAGENWTAAAYTAGSYEYTLNSQYWISFDVTTYITISRKILTFGVLWLGHLDNANFVSQGGTNRGNQLTFTEIESDSTDGTARYTMTLLESGDNAGGFVTFYNTTEYDNATHAWDNDELHLVHGVGLENTATNDIGALIVSLLLFQLPDVPFLINALIATPIWACIIFVFWFIVKEMIPFV